MMNYLRAAEKKKQAPPTTPTRLQGKEKRTKHSASIQDDTDPVEENPDTRVMNEPERSQDSTTWQKVKANKQKTTSVRTKQSKAAKKKLLNDSDDSDSENESGEDQMILIPEKKKEYILLNQAVSARFTLIMELETTLEPIQYLKNSVTKMNKILKRVTASGQLKGFSGRAVMIPWEDREVYSDRAWNRAKRGTEHTSLLKFVRQLLYGYGAPKGRKQDSKTSKKFCRMNIAWVSTDEMNKDQADDLLDFLMNFKLNEPESLALYLAPTSAIEPTIAVQFRHSIVSNPSNWSDKGHEDCFLELNQMIRSFLPTGTIAGLKKVTFATGQNFMKGDPTMITLECEKGDEQTVTNDILQAFRSINRKSQIRDKVSVPWIAVPYFKGQGIQANQKYTSQYVEIKTKEALYQNNVMMRYIDQVHSLDTPASPHFHLSKEFLKQLEQDIWERNETPIRALIYDKLFLETQQSLLEQKLSSVNNPSERTIAAIKTKITYHQILDEMAQKGYETLAPYDEFSFPCPNPSERTLANIS